MRRFSRPLGVAVLSLLTLAVCGLYARQQSQPPPPAQGQQPTPAQQPPAPPQQTQPPPASQPPQQPSSQEPQLKVRTQNQQPAISVEVKTVSVLAVVRDKHGKIIPDLKKEDFQLDEDGRTQKIDYFARESDLPLRLGLLVDTSLSQRRVIDQERDASYSFLDHLMRENKDLAFVIHFDHEVELLQDFTPSRPKLQAALQQLQLPQSDSASSTSGGSNGGGGYGGGYPGGGGRRGGGMHGGGTQLYDAIYLGSDELMSKQQGRKAIIVLSDGVDHGSKETMAEAIAAAERADTIIYSVYFSDEDEGGGFNRGGFGMGGPGGMGRRGGGYPQQQRPDGKKILEQISEQTGGRLFKASKKETLDKIYAEIDEDLRNQYSMAYTPDKGNTVGYHKIHLTVPNQKDLVVTARDGYYYGQ
jgi:VWFA-related protein